MQKSQIIQPTPMQTPFAINGTKNIPSQTASGTDTSSIDAGFLPITGKALDDGGQAPQRPDFNGLFYLSTDFKVFLQNGSPITFDTTVSNKIGGYPEDAILTYRNGNNFGFVRSLHDNNNVNFVADATKINGTDWAYVHLLNIDTDIATVNSTIAALQNNLQGQITTNKNNITTAQNTANNAQSTANNALSVANSKISASHNGGAYGGISFSNNVKINWGESSTTSDTYKTVTFTYPFANTTNYQIVATIRTTNDTAYAAATYRVSASQARIYANNSSFSWIAIGT